MLGVERCVRGDVLGGLLESLGPWDVTLKLGVELFESGEKAREGKLNKSLELSQIGLANLMMIFPSPRLALEQFFAEPPQPSSF